LETPVPSYHCHRYPAEIIAQCVRIYYHFPLSHRSIEELMFDRGVIVSYESIRRWCHKFGPLLAPELRSRRPRPKGTWHLDRDHRAILVRRFATWHDVTGISA
jgi:putative transposase